MTLTPALLKAISDELRHVGVFGCVKLVVESGIVTRIVGERSRRVKDLPIQLRVVEEDDVG